MCVCVCVCVLCVGVCLVCLVWVCLGVCSLTRHDKHPAPHHPVKARWMLPDPHSEPQKWLMSPDAAAARQTRHKQLFGLAGSDMSVITHGGRQARQGGSEHADATETTAQNDPETFLPLQMG